MRFWLLLLTITTYIVCLSAKNYVAPEQTLFPVQRTGHTTDTLLFPIRENQDNAIRREVPPSALFLKKPSNIKDSIIYDPVSQRYVVMTLIGDKYYYSRP